VCDPDTSSEINMPPLNARIAHQLQHLAWLMVMSVCWLGAPAASRAETLLIEVLKQPGHIALMRHALAPFGTARVSERVAAEFLGPCETQRNLNDAGRADARRIGSLFRGEGVVFDQVYSSRWCRCRETAELVIGRPAEHLPLIDSYWTDPDKSRGPAQVAALKKHINEKFAPTARMLLVTHGSLIADLSGVNTGEAEIVVVKADGKGGVVVVARGVP
jgi:phosphohistidine phosphatase SixA